MKINIHTLWINTKPFRSIWFLPILLVLVFLILMIVIGNSTVMECDWSERDRWECSKPLVDNS